MAGPKGLEYQSVSIRDTPPSKTELEAMLDAHEGQYKLFNTSTSYDPEIKNRLPGMTMEEKITLLSAQGIQSRDRSDRRWSAATGFKPEIGVYTGKKRRLNIFMSYEIPNEWVNAVNQGDVDRIMKCYDDNASLLATFAADPIRTREGIRAYFDGFTAREGAGVRILEGSVVHDSCGNEGYLATGLYEFFYTKNGSEIRHPARFTFMVGLIHRRGIQHHHSSLIPSS